MFKIFWVDNNSQTEEHVSDDTLHMNEMMHESEEEVWQIAVDIVEDYDMMYIIAPIAGIELHDMDVFVNNNTLTIRGTRKKPEGIFTDNATVRNTECFWGRFVRNVILPENLDFAKVKAIMENNLLVVSLPKLRFDSQSVKINRIDIE